METSSKRKKKIQKNKKTSKIEDKDLECLGAENKLKMEMIARKIKNIYYEEANKRRKQNHLLESNPKRFYRE